MFLTGTARIPATFPPHTNKLKKGDLMKFFAAALAAAILLAAPALAQNTDAVGGTQQNEPGTGGTSKPGVQGEVGGKNGPAATPNDAGNAHPPANTSGSSTAAATDNSKVPGLPGNKSGPAEKAK